MPNHVHLIAVPESEQGLVEKPEEYPWSSASAHREGKNDILVKVSPLLEMVGDWQKFLSQEVAEKETEALKLHELTGRPLGSEDFVIGLEKNRSFAPAGKT